MAVIVKRHEKNAVHSIARPDTSIFALRGANPSI
jgi:hypothetical protein